MPKTDRPTTISVELVLSRLAPVKRRRDGGWSAKCPAHDGTGDHSLSVHEGRLKPVLLKCWAGCTYDAIVRALGLGTVAVPPTRAQPSPRQRTAGRTRPITLTALAQDKALPIPFLIALGVHDLPQRGVGIPYYDETRTPQHVKRRTALRATEGSYWPAGQPLMPYGLEDLAHAREVGSLVIPEGESDRWTLVYHGFPCLAIPGAAAVGCLTAAHVQGISRVYLIREPDAGGAQFVPGMINQLHALGWRGELRVVALTGAKDPNDLHRQNPKGFKAAFQTALDQATPEPSEPSPVAVDASRNGYYSGALDVETELANETAALQAEPPSDHYPCPDALWIGIYQQVAERLGKRSWEIWVGTTAALGAIAARQIDVKYHGALYGMVYLLLVKPTGLGKSECTNTCRGLLPHDYTVRDAVQSGPALAPILAEITRDTKDRVVQVHPRPAILVIEEWTALLHSAGIANSTLVDTINLLFHRRFPWNVSRSDRAGAGGDLVIKQPTLSICATTTVSLLTHSVNEGMIRSGFLNRHLVLPGTNDGWRFYHQEAAGIDFDHLAGLLDPLRHHDWPRQGSVWESYTTEARTRLVSWGEAILEPLMQSGSLDAEALKRLHVYAHIISLLYAWSARSPYIELAHVEAAIAVITISKAFLESLLNAPDDAQPPPIKRYEIALERKILALVQAEPGMIRREVVRKLAGRSAKSADINLLISQLVDLGRLQETRGESTGGRPPIYLSVVQKNLAKSTG